MMCLVAAGEKMWEDGSSRCGGKAGAGLSSDGGCVVGRFAHGAAVGIIVFGVCEERSVDRCFNQMKGAVVTRMYRSISYHKHLQHLYDRLKEIMDGVHLFI